MGLCRGSCRLAGLGLGKERSWLIVVVIVVLLMALDYKSGYPRWVFQAQERELATGLASSLPHTLSIQLPNTVLDCLPVRQEPTASVRGPSPVKIWEGRDSGDLAGWSDSARRGFQQPDDGQYEMLRAQWKRNKATLCDASRDLRAKGVLKRPNASHSDQGHLGATDGPPLLGHIVRMIDLALATGYATMLRYLPGINPGNPDDHTWLWPWLSPSTHPTV